MWFDEEMLNVIAERFLRISNWLPQKIEILQTPIVKNTLIRSVA